MGTQLESTNAKDAIDEENRPVFVFCGFPENVGYHQRVGWTEIARFSINALHDFTLPSGESDAVAAGEGFCCLGGRSSLVNRIPLSSISLDSPRGRVM